MSKKAGIALVACALALVLGLSLSIHQLRNILTRTGSFNIHITQDISHLPRWMQLALSPNTTPPHAGTFTWHKLQPGLEFTEVPVLIGTEETDRIQLLRIDPSHFRFELLYDSTGQQNLSGWMTSAKPTALLNASFYSHHGAPITPVLSNRKPLGPSNYNATHGAFTANRQGANVKDLRNTTWQTAFNAAENAFVSYPLLLAEDGTHRAPHQSGWANRSFIGEDAQGRILFGTTRNAFFTLESFALFLKQASLNLKMALNLDGGPVACQAISTPKLQRSGCGKWEMTTYGPLTIIKRGYQTHTWPLPLALAIYPQP